jgi:hypothetical protein
MERSLSQSSEVRGAGSEETMTSGSGDGGAESGPGELDVEEEIVVTSRRGESKRSLHVSAYSSASFPAYPLPTPEEEPFGLPEGFVDKDAPISARKWCAAAAAAARPQPRVPVHAFRSARRAPFFSRFSPGSHPQRPCPLGRDL